jgi:two-component system phosphate regulon sensor histidine kinase PhoR
MEVNYYPLPTGPEGRVELLAVVLRDMTERKHAEDQREDFLRLVSHDLRSPLVGIGGFAQVLLRQFEKAGASEADRKYLKFIAVGAERMTAIIQDLVDLVQLEGEQAEIRAQAVALSDFVRDYLERAAVTMDVGRVITDLPAGLPPVASDPSRLERILTNLLSNALKYSPCEAPVHLAAERAGGEVLVSVTDEGPGIAPEDLPRLFDRFYRCKTARKREGLGLGLYIAKMLVEAQGGRIWVDSEPEKGSAFRFTLPVAGGSGAAS